MTAQPAKRPAPAAEAIEPPPGIVCPRCGCRHMIDAPDGRHWRTAKTENHPGYIRRRRVCRHCGRVVYTRETIEPR